MTKDRLKTETLTLDEATNIVSHVVASRLKWGKHYDGSDLGYAKILDALVAIAQTENSETTELRKELAAANRRVGAANARLAKYEKKEDQDG